MNQIVFLPFFKKKLLKECKKYISLKTDFLTEMNVFLKTKEKFKFSAEYGLYKIRVPIKSAQKGKSGGYRVLILLGMEDIYFPITLYSKSDQESLPRKEISRILAQAKVEIDVWSKEAE